MPRPYPPEFRFRAAALVRAGKPITIAAMELGIRPAVFHRWVCQDQDDRGERPGLTTTEPAQLPKANKRIRQLVPADSDGFVQLLSRAESLGQPVPFGIAGTDSYGGALTPFVRRRSYRLPDRNDGYAGWSASKSDTIDAQNAAKAIMAGFATAEPKTADGTVEMIRQLKVAHGTAVKARATTMVTLKAILVNAPETLRSEAVRKAPIMPARHCAALTVEHLDSPDNSIRITLASLARR